MTRFGSKADVAPVASLDHLARSYLQRRWDCKPKCFVKSRHRGTSNQCPLYPRKRTLTERGGMSALCQFQTSLTKRHPALRSHKRPGSTAGAIQSISG